MEKNILYEKQNKNQTSEKFVWTNDSRFRGQEHWASSLDSVMMMQPPKAEKICKTGRKLGQFHCVAEMKIDRISNTNTAEQWKKTDRKMWGQNYVVYLTPQLSQLAACSNTDASTYSLLPAWIGD